MSAKEKKQKKKNPLKIMDTTFRDGHQSLLATRLRIEDMLPIMEVVDSVGFHAIEVWGGATFDVTTRYLNEDPWERLKTLKKMLPNTPLSMLLRGQNLVGYRNYADDVVREFVLHAAECGMDIFRVFDALNDERNFEASFETIKETGRHIQATICYTLTERRLGGPVFNVDYFVNKAKVMQQMGADSLCIKDMAGLASPSDIYDLVRALKKKITIPIQFHTHYTSGMGSMSYLKAIEAGVDIVDTALAPFALRTSQPALEPIVIALEGTERDTGLDMAKLFKIGEHIESIAPKYRDFCATTKMSVIDTGVLIHQIPGGMISNLVNQLRNADALDRLNEVYEELPQTRKELGYPPLVTPTSQIVGVQAVWNVLMGRYKTITSEVKDYCYGLYGTPPQPIDPKVREQALKGYPRGEEPITCRAADVLEPEIDKAKKATRGIARDRGDLLIYALYPQTGMRFLRWKYGLEEPPEEVRAKTMEQVRKEDELIKKALAGELVEKTNQESAIKGPGVRRFNVFVGGECYPVEVDEVGGVALSMVGEEENPAASLETTGTANLDGRLDRDTMLNESSQNERVLRAPVPGMITEVKCSVGQEVKAGDETILLEAMKMQNSLAAPIDGMVEEIYVQAGDNVKRGNKLVLIA